MDEMALYLPQIYAQQKEDKLAQEKLDLAQADLEQTQALFDQGQATEKELADRQMALQEALAEQSLAQQRELTEESLAQQRESDAAAAKISGANLAISGVGAGKTAYEALKEIPKAYRKIRNWLNPQAQDIIDVSPITTETSFPATSNIRAAEQFSAGYTPAPYIVPMGAYTGVAPASQSTIPTALSMAEGAGAATPISAGSGGGGALEGLKAAYGRASPFLKTAGVVTSPIGLMQAGKLGQAMKERYGRLGGGLSGATTGALAGTAMLPGPGTVLGAAFGALTSQFGAKHGPQPRGEYASQEIKGLIDKYVSRNKGLTPENVESYAQSVMDKYGSTAYSGQGGTSESPVVPAWDPKEYAKRKLAAIGATSTLPSSYRNPYVYGANPYSSLKASFRE